MQPVSNTYKFHTDLLPTLQLTSLDATCFFSLISYTVTDEFRQDGILNWLAQTLENSFGIHSNPKIGQTPLAELRGN